MTKIKLPHVHEFIDRHGKLRRYVRVGKKTKQIPLPGKPGTAEFMAVYQAVLAGREIEQQVKAPIGPGRTLSGSIDAALVGFYGHQLFTELAVASQTTRRQCLEPFRREHGKKPIAALQEAHIDAMVLKLKPAAGRNLLNSIKALMRFAKLTGLVQHDPAVSLRPPKVKPGNQGIHSWNEDEIAQFRAHHEIGTLARLALELALNTAARRGDLIKLGPQHIGSNGRLTYKQQKTGMQVNMPIHPELLTVLAATPVRHALFLVSSRTGKPFVVGSFGNIFRHWCNLAGLPQCSVHGLRKAQARRLAEAGCSAPQIMALTGHKTLSEVQRYIDAANRESMATSAMAIVSAAFENAPGTASGKPFI